MFVVANFVTAVAQVLTWLLDILTWLIIIRAFLSWVNPDPYNAIVQFIEKTTEPILAPFRMLIPSYKIGLDLSPLFALLVLFFLKSFLIPTLYGIAMRVS